MAVASLRFRLNSSLPEESKSGYVIFDGNPCDYHHWFFRTQLKIRTTKEDEMSRTIQQIVENLRSDALNVAMEIGLDILLDDGGVEVLYAKMLAHIFPVSRHESKALFREGSKTREGVFTRQPSESMQSYILRRKRWWSLLRQLDKTIQLSDEHLGDLLLDASNIQDWQRQMILTSTGNVTTFADIESALMQQMSQIHKRESRSQQDKGKGSGRNFQRGGYYSAQYRKPFQKTAQMADYEEDDTCQHCEDEHEEPCADDEYYDEEIDDAFLAHELNLLEDIDEATSIADIDPNVVADTVQKELIALAAWDNIGKAGKGKGKSKGKSIGVGKGKFVVRASNLTLEERKARLAKLKLNTRCSGCGGKGHWAKDPECPKNKQPAARSSVMPIAQLACLQPTRSFVDSAYMGNDDGEAYVVTGATTSATGSAPLTSVEGVTSNSVVTRSVTPTGTADAEITAVSGPTSSASSAGTLQQRPAQRANTAMNGESRFTHGPYKNETFLAVASSQDPQHVNWVASLRSKAPSSRAAYQIAFLEWLDSQGSSSQSSSMKPMFPQCAPGGCRMRATKGTNAYVAQLVCEICNFRKTERADDTKYLDSKQCPHERLTKMKSSSKFVRFHCLDCNTTVESMTREEYTKSAAAAKEVEMTSGVMRTTISKVAKDVIMSPAETQRVLHVFGSHVTKFIAEREGKDVLASELHTLLTNSVDMVRPIEDVGMVAISPTAFTTSTMSKKYDPSLPIVDLDKSPYLWAVLDTACNSSVQGSGWRRKAVRRWKKLGLGCTWVHRNERAYGGLAGPQTAKMIGKLKWPLLVCSKDGYGPGYSPHYVSAETNEVEGDTNFLMGLDLQRHMNISVCVVTNECHRRTPYHLENGCLLRWYRLQVLDCCVFELIGSKRLDSFVKCKVSNRRQRRRLL